QAGLYSAMTSPQRGAGGLVNTYSCRGRASTKTSSRRGVEGLLDIRQLRRREWPLRVGVAADRLAHPAEQVPEHGSMVRAGDGDDLQPRVAAHADGLLESLHVGLKESPGPIEPPRRRPDGAHHAGGRAEIRLLEPERLEWHVPSPAAVREPAR